jgi:hypothetical protein
VEQPALVRRADGLLTEIEAELGLPAGTIALGARLSNPETLERDAHAIATASRRMMWLFLDLPQGQIKEDPTDPSTKGYYYYHSALIAATAQADIDAIDGMSDSAQLEAETLFAANLGFHGKLVTMEQAARVAEIMNPPRAGERPAGPSDAGWGAYRTRWVNCVERALEILELYATADQERNLGAVAYNDPVTNQPELVDLLSAVGTGVEGQPAYCRGGRTLHYCARAAAAGPEAGRDRTDGRRALCRPANDGLCRHRS